MNKSKLQQIREAQGLPRYLLARKARVSTATIVLIEDHGLYPGMGTMMKLARTLGVPVEEILPEGGEPHALQS